MRPINRGEQNFETSLKKGHPTAHWAFCARTGALWPRGTDCSREWYGLPGLVHCLKVLPGLTVAGHANFVCDEVRSFDAAYG